MWERMTSDHIYIDAADLYAKKAESERKRKSVDKAKESWRKSKYCHQDNSIAARKAYAQHDGFTEPDDMENNVSLEY